MRSSSSLVGVDAEVIFKEEMRWRKFWTRTCLALGVVEILLLGCHVLAKEHRSSIVGVAGVGEVELSFNFLFKKLVTNTHCDTNCSCQD